jgi:hypothetical protein
MIIVLGIWTYLHALLAGPTAVALENVALRHQLAILQRSVPRPRLRRRDRILWVCLSRLWKDWRASLLLVRLATVLAWHRQGFQRSWRWKSRRRSPGRPAIDVAIRALIRRMARENPTWGRRRIQAELRFLGYHVAALTVAKYMRRSPRHLCLANSPSGCEVVDPSVLIRTQCRRDDQPPAPFASSPALPLRRPPPARPGESRLAPSACRLQASDASDQTPYDGPPLVGRAGQSWTGWRQAVVIVSPDTVLLAATSLP